MSHPRTKAEILAALEANERSIAEIFAARSDEVFFSGDPEHWGPAHHLVHLTMTSRAIAAGLRSGRLPAHPSGYSRGYGELIESASRSVGAAPKALLLERGRLAEVPREASRAELMEDFRRASRDLRAAADAWVEADLDGRAMPHPYMGDLTMREMLLFCVFHERHHGKLHRARW